MGHPVEYAEMTNLLYRFLSLLRLLILAVKAETSSLATQKALEMPTQPSQSICGPGSTSVTEEGEEKSL